MHTPLAPQAPGPKADEPKHVPDAKTENVGLLKFGFVNGKPRASVHDIFENSKTTH